MAKEQAKLAKIKFQQQRESMIKQKQLAEKQRIQKTIQSKISLAVTEFAKKQQLKEHDLDAKLEAKFKRKQAKAEEEKRKRAEERERLKKQAEEAREQEKQIKEQEAAEKKKLEEEQKQEAEKKKQLEDEAHKAKKAAEKARHDTLEAQKKEKLAKNEQEAREAKEAAEKAAQAAADAEDARKKVQAAKEEIEKKILASKTLIEEQEKAEKAAQSRIKALEEREAKLKKEQEAAAKRFEKEKQLQEDRVKAQQDKLAAKAKKNAEYLAELSKKQEDRQKGEADAAKKAHDQAIQARKLAAANQAADFKRRLEARRAQFSSEFGNVWVNGPTQVFMAYMSVADQGMRDNIINNLFFENVVADVRTFKQPMTKSFMKNGNIIVEDGEHEIIVITSDDRSKDLLSTVQKTTGNDKFDMVFIPVSTGNRNYIEWVADQTISRSAAKAMMQKANSDGNDEEGLDDVEEESPGRLKCWEGWQH